jgi:hypothetical protein
LMATRGGGQCFHHHNFAKKRGRAGAASYELTGGMLHPVSPDAGLPCLCPQVAARCSTRCALSKMTLS